MDLKEFYAFWNVNLDYDANKLLFLGTFVFLSKFDYQASLPCT